METKFVFEFSADNVEGQGDWKALLGGKGAGLAAMSGAGLPVPPGFTISTEACAVYQTDPHGYQREVIGQVNEALSRLEAATGKTFGAAQNALLLSVRSGAKFSMPGMMGSVLNIGLNDETVETLARETGNPRFAFDCYRRLLQMFGDVVLEVPARNFELVLFDIKKERQVSHEIQLSAEDLRNISARFKEIIEHEGKAFPQDPRRQLELATEAVFRSWNNPRAVTYRRLMSIPGDLGTAVNVQTMVFGNLGERSGSGVGFTRNPATGENELYGEYLPQAQGEEVVAGTRTPLPFSHLKINLPELYQELSEIALRLENYYREMQDFEFTIEDGVLFMLQTRDGKRTGKASVRIASDLYKEGLINADEALLRVTPAQLEQLLHPVFVEHETSPLATGLPASPGAAVGGVVFTAADAVARKEKGEAVILVRSETTPDDIHGMQAAEGILTQRGGMTSHAAVVARGMGKCAVVGCESLHLDEEAEQIEVRGQTLKTGDWISLDGTQGAVYTGQLDRVEPKLDDPALTTFMDLIASVDAMDVRANADSGRDAQRARDFGAVGIGLCRTEHMFFGEDRLPAMQRLILAEGSFERERAAAELREFQRNDFSEILEVMDGLPVTIRLLDPPLHEFLPSRSNLESELKRMRDENAPIEGIRFAHRLLRRLDELKEVNPMMGHRGCRLGITYPEVTRMQAEALFEAASHLIKKGHDPRVELMIPLVSMASELKDQVDEVRRAMADVQAREGVEVPCLLGTMIELPRAAIVADELAEHAEFFSFGTNDLTQTAYGFSRDDSGRFLAHYLENKIMSTDPFQSIDQVGVGYLVELACTRGREVRQEIKLGVCGEHGGDPESVLFFQSLGLDYVSCSPFRVPGARLAAAQAAVSQKQGQETAKKVAS